MLGKGVTGWSFAHIYILISSYGCVFPSLLLPPSLQQEAPFLLQIETTELLIVEPSEPFFEGLGKGWGVDHTDACGMLPLGLRSPSTS